MAGPTNRDDILAFLAEGETYSLPNGAKLSLTMPTVSDLVKFQRMAKEAEDVARKSEKDGEPVNPETTTRLPLFLLQAVTKGYDFDDDQCLQLYSKTGGLTGSLANKVYSLFGMDLTGAKSSVSEEEPDHSTPTE